MKSAMTMALTSILDVKVQCGLCRWKGQVRDCEPDVDGDGSLGCPECYQHGVRRAVAMCALERRERDDA